MPGLTLVSSVPVPRLVPVPPVWVHHVTTAPVPVTPFAVRVVTEVGHIGEAAAEIELISTHPTCIDTDAVSEPPEFLATIL